MELDHQNNDLANVGGVESEHDTTIEVDEEVSELDDNYQYSSEEEDGFRTQEEGDIEVDSEASCGTDWLSIPSSSSIIGYVYENGRTYHQYHEGNYFMPNDERENDRLDLQYHMLNVLFGGNLFFAPIKTPKRILDLGTGTGIWAIDMADMYPEATVIANDLSAIQPTWVPPNCKFEIDDIESPWAHARNSFDLIHTRYLFGSLQDWPRMIKQAYDHLAPGGYLELQESDPETLKSDDNTIPPNNALGTWCNLFVEASNLANRPLSISGKLKGWMQDAGFVDVTERVFKLPTNPWARDRRLKEVGRLNAVNLVEGGGLEASILALFTRWLGWDLERCMEFVEGAKKVVKNREVHAYWEVIVIYGKKPLPPNLPSSNSLSHTPSPSILTEKLEELTISTTSLTDSASSSSASSSSLPTPSIPQTSAPGSYTSFPSS